MPKLKVYVATSVISALVDDHLPERQAVLQVLFASLEKGDEFTPFLSVVALDELHRGPERLLREFQEVAGRVAFQILDRSEEAEALADRYILEGIVTERRRVDALHLAIATVDELYVVLSWNFRHMVNLKRIRRLNGVNLMLGYGQIDVRTPEEVVDEGK